MLDPRAVDSIMRGLSGNIWTHIQSVTGYRRDAIKEIVFCFCFGGLGSATLFDVARRHKFDLEAIANIRGAADEWLRGF